MNNCYAPVLVSGEKAAFYANLTIPTTSDLSSYQLTLVDLSFTPKSENAGNLNVIEVAEGTGLYHFWSELVPFAEDGYYRFIIHDTTSDIVLFVSNIIEVRDKADEALLKVAYRSQGNLYGFMYSLLADFYNTLYLDLIAHKPQPGEEASGFDDTRSVFIRTRSVLREQVAFATQWFDREAHRAFVSMCGHKYLLIDGKSYRKTDDSSYEIQWTEGGGMGYGYDVACGEILLEDLTYASANNDC